MCSRKKNISVNTLSLHIFRLMDLWFLITSSCLALGSLGALSEFHTCTLVHMRCFKPATSCSPTAA